MIKILNEDTIQKIAAGEVVERPASIVKELVENSIDAKSNEIIVEIKNGGKSYIKVSDNGIGIAKDDVETAFKRHATSKIDTFDDLYKIYSMGFRGEALASIVSASNVVMKTKFRDEEIGSQIEYDNNKLVNKKKIATNTGTTIEVLDLFEYIPARKRFLASDITEGNKITNLLYIFAIGNPNISFTYIKDNREIFTTNKNFSKKDNLSTLFGPEFIKNSIEINSESKNYKLHGTISNNKYYKGNRSMQFIYVNGRYIENEAITESIESAYYSLIPNGRFPLFELQIEVDANLIDINIHPNKQKIKFSFNEELLELIKSTILKALITEESSKDIEVKKEESNIISFHELNNSDNYQKILDAYKSPISFEVEDDKEEMSFEKDIISFNEIDDEFMDDNQVKIETNNLLIEEENIVEQTKIEIEELDFKTTIFNNYLLFENITKKTLKIIDIFRANIRILYDREINNDQITSQSLIEPIIVDLINKDMEIFEQNKDVFSKIGYDVETFGDNSVIVRAIPYYLNEPSTIEDLKLLLGDEYLKNSNDISSHLLRSAISKSNYRKVINNEDEALLFYDELLKTSNPYTDPNGRSIIFNINSDEFSKIINRI